MSDLRRRVEGLREEVRAELRLCYVEEGGWAYFAACDPTEVWGDDWNDRPHDCNAGTPYSETAPSLTKVAFDGDLEVMGTQWSPRHPDLSAEEINKGEAPWLAQVLYGQGRDERDRLRLGVEIPAGVTLSVFDQLVGEAGGSVYHAQTPGEARLNQKSPPPDDSAGRGGDEA